MHSYAYQLSVIHIIRIYMFYLYPIITYKYVKIKVETIKATSSSTIIKEETRILFQ